MSIFRCRSGLKRSKKRSYRRRSRLPGAAAAALLALVLIAAGVYYAGVHQRNVLYAQYPLRYKELIVENAERFELEPWHVAAVVRCESSFRETATSNVGAMGLMQIMPDTGLWLAGKFDEEDSFTDEMLYQPEINLKYGCWFLQWLMTRYEGGRWLRPRFMRDTGRWMSGWLTLRSVPTEKRLNIFPTARRGPTSNGCWRPVKYIRNCMILPYLMRMRLDSVDEEISMKEKTNGLLRLTALLTTLMLLLSGCSAESEASFETIIFLAGKVDALGLRAVITLKGSDGEIAKTVVSTSSAKNADILTLDSMQTTTAKDTDSGATYLAIMESNLEVLKLALK